MSGAQIPALGSNLGRVLFVNAVLQKVHCTRSFDFMIGTFLVDSVAYT